MGLCICFVTPFSWSQPNDVNEHVRGAAEALRTTRSHGDDRGAVLDERPICSKGVAPCSAA